MRSHTIEEALQRASFCLEKAGLEQPRMEAELLLSHVLQSDRLQLFLNREEELPAKPAEQFEKLVRRRCAGEPAAYITGEKYFFGSRFKVNKSVLIPRPETELIVERALHWSDRQKAAGNLKTVSCVDLGTGSGAIAITLALKVPGIRVRAVDISGDALEQAAENAAALGVKDKISWHRGSYFKAFREICPRPRFNLVVSNPPYLSKWDMESLPRDIREFEPPGALYGGEDGLDSYREIFEDLPGYVLKPGLVLLEVGAGQKEQVEDLALESGLFATVSWYSDLAGHPRVMEGKIPGPEPGPRE